MRRFEFNDSSTQKFWEVEQVGSDVNVRYGKMGTGGQSQSKSHADAAAAGIAMAKLIKEKTGKGYVECVAGSAPAATPVKAAAPAKAAAPVKAVAPVKAPAPAKAAVPAPTSSTGMPEVLVNPPWKRKVKRKPAAVLALAALPLGNSEHWPAGQRELALVKPSAYRYWHYSQYPLETIQMFEVGITLPPYTQKAADAVAKRDVAGFGQVCESYRAAEYSNPLSAHGVAMLPPPMGLKIYNALSHRFERDHHRAMAMFGLAALPGLLNLCAQCPTLGMPAAMPIASTALAPLMARAYYKLKRVRDAARRWLLAYPEYAACALIAPALGAPGEGREGAAESLRLLDANGYRALLLEVASRYGQDAVGEALGAMLDEDPMDRFPSRIAPLPPFWYPAGWARPVLRDSGMALPDEALEQLAVMLRISSTDSVYPGIAHVKAACTAPSLAAFAWSLYEAWLEAGGPPKEDWAFKALGLLGDDHTARKLTPFLRAWPGESKSARAVSGLEVLMQIGSDTALTMLNGIALRVKFKPLQEKAREKIAQIAEARDLTPDELEDRMTPHLGLDEQGTMLFDFGARQFRVGFDETLKPFVRDADGARLPTLPRPKNTDDAALSKDAVERFKLLKKEAGAIAARQTLRLERAMCAGRRWESAVFRSVLAGHPLLRHLVQRIVWGAYRVDDGRNFGGTLLATFRAAQDGGFTDADDDAIALMEGDDIRIGIPHALELSAADRAAFAQLFSDYEILQPFEQVGRNTYALSDEDLAANKLTRWEQATVMSGRVLSLATRGWTRQLGERAERVDSVGKVLSDGLRIDLDLDPGVQFDELATVPEQTIRIRYTSPATGRADEQARLSTLAPIVVSELLRDMEGLRA